MEENQNMGNSANIQPEQTVQSSDQQAASVSQIVQEQQTQSEASVSMQIQELLVQQQIYQQQYNELVAYLQKTPNLPIEQVNQIKNQLDQLNSNFVAGKQKLQLLGYNSVQVNKPTQVKIGGKNNFSFKKLAIGCLIILFLIFAGFGITLFSLINNPNALQGIGVQANTAKMILQLFAGLLFGGIIIIILGVVISNIYKIITLKNQSKVKNVLGLVGGVGGLAIFGVLLAIVFGQIGKINTEPLVVYTSPVQAYLVGKVEQVGVDEYKFPYDKNQISGKDYDLIAPSEMAFAVRGNLLGSLIPQLPTESTIQDITLSCGNKQNQILKLSGDVAIVQEGGMRPFEGRCLYGEKGTYTYSLNITYKNNLTNEILSQSYKIDSLEFTSEIIISLTTTNSSSSNNKTSRLYPTNAEFILGKAPAKITIDSTNIFRDFSLDSYNVVRDLDGDDNSDRENQVQFNYSYKIPRVYYPNVKFPDLSDFVYSFPVRVEQSDVPVCDISVDRFPGSTKYQISTDFIDASSAATISSYNYTIMNSATNKAHEILKDQPKEFNYTFPEKGNYRVVLDFVTVDGKQGQCESDIIQLEKETFSIQYTLLNQNKSSNKFSELCTSSKKENNNCTSISVDSIPQKYQLKIDSITPSSNTLKKVVYFNDTILLNENDTYEFDIQQEGTFTLKIVMSDETRGMESEEKYITFNVKKPDIIGSLVITDKDTKQQISEGFEPLTVLLDASKTEINIEGDEIVYFTWDFGDGEIKQNQQNGVISHTYTYDYINENGIFTPKVTITTLKGNQKVITSPVILNVKKGLVDVSLSCTSHPTRQAKVGSTVSFQAEFDGLPESMVRDFGDGTTPTTCQTRSCTDIEHVFNNAGTYDIKLSLDFDALQKVESVIRFKVFE